MKILLEALRITRFSFNLVKYVERFQRSITIIEARIEEAQELQDYIDLVTYGSDRELGRGQWRIVETCKDNRHPLIKKYC